MYVGRAGTGRISIDAAGPGSEWEWGHFGGTRPTAPAGMIPGPVQDWPRGIEFGHDCRALAMIPSAMCVTERIMASTSIKGHHVCMYMQTRIPPHTGRFSLIYFGIDGQGIYL